MNRRSPAVMLNPWLTGAVCCCAWTAGWNTGCPIGDRVMAIIIATAQRFAERERRQVNGCFLIMIFSRYSALPHTHTSSYSDPMAVIGLLPLRDTRARMPNHREKSREPLEARCETHTLPATRRCRQSRVRAAPVTKPMLESRDYEAAERELLRRRAKRASRASKSLVEELRRGKKARLAAVGRGQNHGPVSTEAIVVIAVEFGVRWLLVNSRRAAERMRV